MSVELPQSGSFKVSVIGPVKEIQNKKDPNHPWKTYDLQFEGDPNWYNTFWVRETPPEEGETLKGTKMEADRKEWGLKFELERQGGKKNWNPAQAQATVFVASATVLNGFLSLGDHYKLWSENDPKLKPLFQRYLATVDNVAGQVKDKIVAMGKIEAESKTSESSTTSGSEASNSQAVDDIPGFPGDIEDEEEINV